MPTATSDSGPSATVVSPKLLELRQTCDRMDIKWHWRHKESTLEGYIAQFDEMKVTGPKITEAAPEPEREQRPIPQDVLDALAYCNGYHRGNTKRIRAYIDEIR